MIECCSYYRCASSLLLLLLLLWNTVMMSFLLLSLLPSGHPDKSSVTALAFSARRIHHHHPHHHHPRRRSVLLLMSQPKIIAPPSISISFGARILPTSYHRQHRQHHQRLHHRQYLILASPSSLFLATNNAGEEEEEEGMTDSHHGWNGLFLETTISIMADDEGIVPTRTSSSSSVASHQKQQQQQQQKYHPPYPALTPPSVLEPMLLQLERTSAGLGDLSTLLCLGKDFVDRPEVFSSLLISDFAVPPLLAHQTRVVVMGMIRKRQVQQQQQQQQQNSPQLPSPHNKDEVRNDWPTTTAAAAISNNNHSNPTLASSSSNTKKAQEKDFPMAWEASLGSFPSTTFGGTQSLADPSGEQGGWGMTHTHAHRRMSHDVDNNQDDEIRVAPVTTIYKGYKDGLVNDKASQRRRKARDAVDDAPQDHSSSSKIHSKINQASYEYGLPADYEAIYPTLATELKAYYKFMTEPSTRSQEDPIKPATANIYFRHAKLFLGWFVQHQPEGEKGADEEPEKSSQSLILSMYSIIPNKEKESADAIISFVMWLRTERQIGPAYEANLLRGLIKFLKFRFAQESETDASYGGNTFTDIPLIKELRKLHRSADQKRRTAPKSSDEQKKWLSWPEYLQVIQKTKEETLQLIQRFHQLDESKRRYRSGQPKNNNGEGTLFFCVEEEEIAAAFQKYLILAIFASIPDRQRTIRELEIGRTLIKDMLDNNNGNNNDSCYYVKHGPDDYKTGKAYGERPPLQLAPELTPALDDFIERWRPALQPTTNFLFVQARTGKPLTQDSVFDRVRRSCFKYTGKMTNPHLLRSMIITHVREESNASEKELEALALFMGHSIQMQRSSYDKRTLKKKIAPAVQLMQTVNSNSNSNNNSRRRNVEPNDFYS